MDSVLVNGRGAVYCPGTKNISSVELSYLKTAIDNQPLTDKGYVCIPLKPSLITANLSLLQVSAQHLRDPRKFSTNL